MVVVKPVVWNFVYLRLFCFCLVFSLPCMLDAGPLPSSPKSGSQKPKSVVDEDAPQPHDHHENWTATPLQIDRISELANEQGPGSATKPPPP